MDILVSSNLERLLYELSGEDAARVSSWMADLSLKGFYDAGPAMRGKIGKMFFGGWTSEEDTLRTIGTLWHSRGYVADTHTAVGMNVYERYVSESGDLSPTVLASTASPFKFANSVAGALFGQEALCGHDDFDLLELLSDKTGWPIPAGLAGLRERPVLHEEICAVEDMAAVVSRLLGIRGLQEGHGNG